MGFLPVQQLFPISTCLLLATALAYVVPPSAPALPNTIVLDGLRDADYVLVAEDLSDDLAVVDVEYQWADLTRLYVATDADNLYVYADLPNYTLTHSSGEIGLALLFPGGANYGARLDYMPPVRITYAYTASAEGTCAPTGLAQTRYPDVLIRGRIWGNLGGGGADANDGVTFLAVAPDNWPILANWGGIAGDAVGTHIAYAEGAGVELLIPWADLDVAGPVEVEASFFTTTAEQTKPANLDAVPPDPAAATYPTATVLSQLANIPAALPAPASIGLGCAGPSVGEDVGPAVLTAQLHAPLTQTVAVSYSASALTAGPTDFTPVTGTLTFTAGITRQLFSIPITNDSLIEGDETFLVTLSNPLGVALANPMTATVTIVDDDDLGFKVLVPFVTR
jgi:hypothetical protein